MRGTLNTGGGFVGGNVLPPEVVNDSLTLVTTADDDLLFELLELEPGAIGGKPPVAFWPLRRGPAFVAGAGRKITVRPLRVVRGSIDPGRPRAVLSGAFDLEVVMALPPEPPVGQWRVELLYAELAFIDPTAPSKGTQITLLWAPSPGSAAVTGGPPFAVLPADTTNTWNVPLLYVRNVGGAALSALDLWEHPPQPLIGVLGNVQARLAARKTGIDVGRGYASALNDPRELVVGGTSKLVGALGPARTSASIGRFAVEECIRSFFIPGQLVVGTKGVTVYTPVDDTRDWRGAEFMSFWVVPQPSALDSRPGFDDPGSASADKRHLPAPRSLHATASSAIVVTTGHSHDAYAPAPTLESKRWAALVGAIASNGSINGIAEKWFSDTNFVGLVVGDDGVLYFACNTTFTSILKVGPGLWIKTFATFTRVGG